MLDQRARSRFIAKIATREWKFRLRSRVTSDFDSYSRACPLKNDAAKANATRVWINVAEIP